MTLQTNCVDELFGIATIGMSEVEKANRGIVIALESQISRLEGDPVEVNIDAARTFARRYIHCNLSMARIKVPNVVWADVVRERFKIGTDEKGRNNWMGGLFRDGQFVKVYGERIISKTEGSHGNDIRLWTLRTYLPAIREALTSQRENCCA